MSLPRAFNTTLEDIPFTGKYLSTDPKKVHFWERRLGLKRSRRVGVVWSGAAKHGNDHNRSIALADLVPIMGDFCEWHSLQTEYRPHDWDVLQETARIYQHQDELHDFSDTAALIECLDLVITVDTSVAHLAGALGKPVWIMLPKVPDFRWLLDRDNSPWYESARLYRQSQQGDWSDVLTTIEHELEAARDSH